MGMNSVYRLRGDVRYRVVDEEGVIVRQDEGEILVLNRVGARIVELVDGKRGSAEIARLLQEDYEADLGKLENDLGRFLTELEEAGVVQPV